MFKAPAPIKTPKIEMPPSKNWLKGVVTALDDGRTPTDGLRASGNQILDQDGTLRPRPSLIKYGTQPTGTILGEIFEFIRAESSVNKVYLGCLQNVAGTTKFYYAKDGGAWTVATGATTFDNTANAHFSQIDDKILITNGVNRLAYFDIPTQTIVPFTALAAQTATSATPAGMTGASFEYWYQVSANSTVGETAASTAVNTGGATTCKLRDLWIPGTDKVTVAWPANASATSATTYNVYLATTDPAAGGTATLIASGLNALSFVDDGTAAADATTPAPLSDTTAGPIAARSSVVNGQVYLTGDTTNIRYVRFGGTGKSVLDFSPFNGGGWVEVGRGTKEVPIKVSSFRDHSGNPKVTVLCKGTNGTGKRYILTPDSVTIGTTIIDFMDVQEDNGQDGTDSPDGVILYKDSLWYPSKDGFKTTGTKPQLQNLLSTDTISETIISDIKNLNSVSMANCVGLAYLNRLYWAIPNGTTKNNEIWVLDLQRGGAWMKPWNIAADWMSLYNDNSGITHHLVLSNNVIYELSDAQATNDDSVTFNTNSTSGIIKFDDSGLVWGKIIDVTFVLLRPQGTINLTVSGKTEDASLTTVGTGQFTTTASVAGWGEAGWGGSPDLTAPQHPLIFGWSNFSVVPVTFGDAQKLITIEVDEELNWWAWELDTNTSGAFYQLSEVIPRFVPIGVKSLDS